LSQNETSNVDIEALICYNYTIDNVDRKEKMKLHFNKEKPLPKGFALAGKKNGKTLSERLGPGPLHSNPGATRT